MLNRKMVPEMGQTSQNKGYVLKVFICLIIVGLIFSRGKAFVYRKRPIFNKNGL